MGSEFRGCRGTGRAFRSPVSPATSSESVWKQGGAAGGTGPVE